MSESVFPQPMRLMNGDPQPGTARGGLTKREMFSAMAMQRMVVDPKWFGDSALFSDVERQSHHECTAIFAVRYADALLAELAKVKA